ncbi:MAG TPA: PadR family transcriptional regulator [Terriglobales bacterium]|nr:PadR family transcriptional regulator [Terriglobales bacterium]
MVHASPLEYALIGLLKQQPQSGYDLRKAFATTPMRHFSDSPGSIYPALRRLQARRWLDSTADKSGRNRRLFRVTQAGNRALVAWLQQPVTREDVIWSMAEAIMRFAFQEGNVPQQVTVRFLQQLETELTAYVRELREYARQSGLARNSSTGALAFASGVEGYEATLRWTKRARKIMEKEK